ncbi:hypothetical protein FIBSPDRAFT_935885 [Athelia psychrophila]|uniref:Uncharacterized protein n=1 Tax=Athelia psychrophila TaxID=1759441 RepID=A0A166CYY4_9AGAM|nr:hypothetical protein FIBSPDRAFT_935885 [Fibularhizoctonia sp. CBS 109695]
MIGLDLQEPNFVFLQRLTFFTVNTDLEIVQDWARDTVPAFPQRGIAQLRTPPLATAAGTCRKRVRMYLKSSSGRAFKKRIATFINERVSYVWVATVELAQLCPRTYADFRALACLPMNYSLAYKSAPAELRLKVISQELNVKFKSARLTNSQLGTAVHHTSRQWTRRQQQIVNPLKNGSELQALCLTCYIASIHFVGIDDRDRVPQPHHPRQRHPHLTADIPTTPGVVDTGPGKDQLYLTHMGHSVFANDGYLVRVAADGTGVDDIVLDGRPERSSWCLIQRWRDCTGHTGKGQFTCDVAFHSALMNLPGLYDQAKAHQGRILRANIDISRTQTTRTNIRTRYANLPEPIDFDLNAASTTLYWTDRGDPPLGNTLSHDVSAPLKPNTDDANDAAAAKGLSKDTVVAGGFHEAIWLSLDFPGRRAFVADLDSGRMEVLMEDAVTVTVIVHREA